MLGYSGHEGQLMWEEANIYALLGRTSCSFLLACFLKIKKPKFHSEVYGSCPFLQGFLSDLGPMDYSNYLFQVYILCLQYKALKSAHEAGFSLVCLCVSIRKLVGAPPSACGCCRAAHHSHTLVLGEHRSVHP